MGVAGVHQVAVGRNTLKEDDAEAEEAEEDANMERCRSGVDGWRSEQK